MRPKTSLELIDGLGIGTGFVIEREEWTEIPEGLKLRNKTKNSKSQLSLF
jgi:hypothetical protein